MYVHTFSIFCFTFRLLFFHPISKTKDRLFVKSLEKSCFFLFFYHSEGTEDGTFLVRKSSSSSGDYVLSVLHKGEVIHYQIRKHEEDAFFSIGIINKEWQRILLKIHLQLLYLFM